MTSDRPPPKTPEEALAHVREAAAEGNIEFAPSSKVDDYAAHVQFLLRTIAEYHDEPGMADAWVSDQSSLGDFGAYEPNELAALLGVEITRGEALWEIAKRLRETHERVMKSLTPEVEAHWLDLGAHHEFVLYHPEVDGVKWTLVIRFIEPDPPSIDLVVARPTVLPLDEVVKRVRIYQGKED